MTQRELSAVTGIPQGTISSAEIESRTPGIDILLKLCRGLGVSPNHLFERAGLLPAEGDTFDEEFWELWGVWKRLTAEEREIVSEFARFWEERRG